MIKGNPVKRCAILADPRNSEMAITLDQARDEVQKHLDDLGIASEVFFGVPPQEIKPHPETDIFLVLGGDGTMIFFAGPLSHLEIPFFGINYGNVGFMMNSIKNGLLAPLKKLQEGQFTCWDFPLLEVDAHDHAGHVHHGLGLNDIYLQRMTVQTCKINLSINGRPLAFNPILCDGVIVSTPLGSTAYSYNATGAVVSIDCPVLTITPLAANRTCPIKSLMLPLDTVIHVQVLEPLKRKVLVVSDGQNQGDISQAFIRLSAKKARLAFSTGLRESFPLRFINKCKA